MCSASANEAFGDDDGTLLRQCTHSGGQGLSGPLRGERSTEKSRDRKKKMLSSKKRGSFFSPCSLEYLAVSTTRVTDELVSSWSAY